MSEAPPSFRRGKVSSAGLLGILVVILTLSGCGIVKEKESAAEPSKSKRSVLHPESAIERTREISSSALDMSGVKGKVSPAGPIVRTDGQHKGNYYVHHAWSVGGVPPTEIKEGMERLRRELPKEGWSIEKYGRANSKARQMQLEAFHDGQKYLMQVEALIRSERGTDGGEPGNSREDLLSFTVMSPSYKFPEGADPHDE
ncbi:hypothetical protein [Streptomyces megasporus]|uniref:hypothetical protein n=1 Tax=Streptomyces megasporus TaxID=44060 RepID=UPI0012FECB19|nr:hypothetical protein [Streptomyces megasporus]